MKINGTCHWIHRGKRFRAVMLEGMRKKKAKACEYLEKAYYYVPNDILREELQDSVYVTRVVV